MAASETYTDENGVVYDLTLHESGTSGDARIVSYSGDAATLNLRTIVVKDGVNYLIQEPAADAFSSAPNLNLVLIQSATTFTDKAYVLNSAGLADAMEHNDVILLKSIEANVDDPPDTIVIDETRKDTKAVELFFNHNTIDFTGDHPLFKVEGTMFLRCLWQSSNHISGGGGITNNGTVPAIEVEGSLNVKGGTFNTETAPIFAAAQDAGSPSMSVDNGEFNGPVFLTEGNGALPTDFISGGTFDRAWDDLVVPGKKFQLVDGSYTPVEVPTVFFTYMDGTRVSIDLSVNDAGQYYIPQEKIPQLDQADVPGDADSRVWVYLGTTSDGKIQVFDNKGDTDFIFPVENATPVELYADYAEQAISGVGPIKIAPTFNEDIVNLYGFYQFYKLKEDGTPDYDTVAIDNNPRAYSVMESGDYVVCYIGMKSGYNPQYYLKFTVHVTITEPTVIYRNNVDPDKGFTTLENALDYYEQDTKGQSYILLEEDVTGDFIITQLDSRSLTIRVRGTP